MGDVGVRTLENIWGVCGLERGADTSRQAERRACQPQHQPDLRQPEVIRAAIQRDYLTFLLCACCPGQHDGFVPRERPRAGRAGVRIDFGYRGCGAEHEGSAPFEPHYFAWTHSVDTLGLLLGERGIRDELRL